MRNGTRFISGKRRAVLCFCLAIGLLFAITTGWAGFFISVKGPGASDEIPRIEVTNLEMDEEATSPTLQGKWSGRDLWDSEHEYLQLECEFGREGEAGRRTACVCIARKECEGLASPPAEAGVRIEVSRPAGRLILEGETARRKASGQARFTGNAGFAKVVEKEVGQVPSLSELLEMALLRVDLDYVSGIKGNVSGKLEVASIIHLKQNGVSPKTAAAFRAAGYTFGCDDLIRALQQGVSSNYARDFRKAGYEYSLDELVRACQQGISSEYAAGFRKAEYNYSLDELIRARQQGISAEYAAGFRKAGHEYSLDELIRARQQGISADYAANFRKAGYNYSLDDLIRARQQGISADWAARFARAGYKFSLDDLIRLRQNGVSSDYAEKIRIEGRKNLSANTIIDCRNRGLSAELVQKLREE
jgi:hypothetical protein